jgi:hypothetical protein
MSNLSQFWTFNGKVNSYKLVKPVKGSNFKIKDFSSLILKDPMGEENQDLLSFFQEEMVEPASIVIDNKRNTIKIVFSDIDNAWQFKIRFGDFLLA